MSLKGDSDFDRHDGWLGAALVFAVAVVAALLLMGTNWGAADGGNALNAANTRPLVMLPLPLR